MNLKINGQSHELTPDNTILFTFREPMYNHVYLTIENKGAYLFEYGPHPDAFQQISKHAIDNTYPAVLNQPEVPDCDRKAFELMAMASVRALTNLGHVPSEWK